MFRRQQEQASQSDLYSGPPLHPQTLYTRRQLVMAAGAGVGGWAVVNLAAMAWAYTHPSTVAALYDETQSAVPGSPFFKLDWTHADVSPRTIRMVDFGNDSKATGDQTSWHKLGMLATNPAALEGVAKKTGCVPAVLFADGNRIGIGYDREGHNFFRPNPNAPGQVVVGMAIGDGDLLAAAAVFNPDKGYVTLPEGGSVSAGVSDKLTIAADFPGTYWV